MAQLELLDAVAMGFGLHIRERAQSMQEELEVRLDQGEWAFCDTDCPDRLAVINLNLIADDLLG